MDLLRNLYSSERPSSCNVYSLYNYKHTRDKKMEKLIRCTPCRIVMRTIVCILCAILGVYSVKFLDISLFSRMLLGIVISFVTCAFINALIDREYYRILDFDNALELRNRSLKIMEDRESN